MGDVPPRRKPYAVTEVMVTRGGMEYSVHSCPRQYRSDLAVIFPGQDPLSLLIVPTCQNSAMDLVRTGEEVEEEKDRLLETFADWAKTICEKLIREGHFADYIDPCSGLPMIHRNTNTVYSEVDALTTLLGYPFANAGCCKVILHPKWGSAVYPATMFTNAPLEDLLGIIHALDTVDSTVQ